MTSKTAYVKSQGQTRNHTCHWPGCEKQCPPAMWGCAGHWFALPAQIRQAIWASFKPGQERTGRPSPEYVEAANAAQAWISEYLAGKAAVKPAQTASQQSRPIDNKTRDLF